MKKKRLIIRKAILLIMLSLPSSLRAVSIEANVSAFFPTNAHIQNIYGNVWPDFAIKFDHITNKTPSLAIFGQIDYLFSKGMLEGGFDRTNIELIPVTFGFKWIHKIEEVVEFYIGVAPKYYYMNAHNDSPYIPHSTTSNGCGIYFTTGGFFYPVKGLVVDFFFSYSYITFKPPTPSDTLIGFRSNLSGFNLGLGIGYKF